MVKQYEGGDYHLPKDETEFKKAMLDTKEGKLGNIKKYKDDVNKKIEWYGGKFCPEQSLLSIACQNGHAKIVNYLISKNAKIDDQDEYGSTPLHYATRSGHLNVVKILVAAGAKVNKKALKQFVRIYGVDTKRTTGTEETPLHNACSLGHLDVVKYLISCGGDLNATDDDGRLPIHKCQQGEWVKQTAGEKKVEDYLNNL